MMASLRASMYGVTHCLLNNSMWSEDIARLPCFLCHVG